MSATSELRDILRRHSVGSQAELTVEATTAAMTIRAALARRTFHARESHLQALQSTLERIGQVAGYDDAGVLGEFVDQDRVAVEDLELVQVMARAAHREDGPGEVQTAGDGPRVDTFPVLKSLVATRNSVAIDGADVTIVESEAAEKLAEGLEFLARLVFNDAALEDQQRTSSYAIS